jgi:hypothetical protein
MGKIRKALWAAAGTGVTAVLASLGTGLADGHLTGTEVGVSVGAGLLAAAAVGRTVWAVPPNDPPS